MDKTWSPEVRAAAAVLEQLRASHFRGSIVFHFNGAGGIPNFHLNESCALAELGNRTLATVVLTCATVRPKP
jgi:hypothetical protein